MEKTLEANKENKKIHDQDRVLLENIQNIMYRELAESLDTSYEEIAEKIKHKISQ